MFYVDYQMHKTIVSEGVKCDEVDLKSLGRKLSQRIYILLEIGDPAN